MKSITGIQKRQLMRLFWTINFKNLLISPPKPSTLPLPPAEWLFQRELLEREHLFSSNDSFHLFSIIESKRTICKYYNGVDSDDLIPENLASEEWNGY